MISVSCLLVPCLTVAELFSKNYRVPDDMVLSFSKTTGYQYSWISLPIHTNILQRARQGKLLVLLGMPHTRGERTLP